jgi:hypothetical protein
MANADGARGDLSGIDHTDLRMPNKDAARRARD